MEPVDRHDCLDLNLLESAAKQPFQAGYGSEFYPTIYEKAACLFFLLAGGHVFTNGNKRTAVLALDQFLYANAIYCVLSNDQMQKLAEDTASYRTRGENHKQVMSQISKLIERNSVPFAALRLKTPKLYRRVHRDKEPDSAFPPECPRLSTATGGLQRSSLGFHVNS